MLIACSTRFPSSSSSSKCFLQQQGCFVSSKLSVKKTHNFLKSSCHGNNPIRCCSKGFSSSFSIQHLSSKPYNRNPILVTSSEYGYPSKSKPDDLNHLSKQFRAFYLFSRPHTIIGTVIGIISVSLLPVETVSDLSPAFFVGVLKALVPSVLMNIYVVGSNQIFDVEIDKVNKPELPLASGNFSMETGRQIVFMSLLMSFGMGIMFKSPPLFCALLISCLLGTAYSIDDIPDVDGGKEFGIQSFTVKLGQKKVFRLCVNMLLMAYGAAIVIGASSSSMPSRIVTIRAQSVDLSSKAAISSFYMFIWKLFYAEYFLIPLVR